MVIAQHLEDFSRQKVAQKSETSETARENLEDQKLASFEEGYSAGWDDAIQAQEKRVSFLNEKLVECIESFSIGLEDVKNSHRDACISLNCQVVSKLLALPSDSYFPKAVAVKIADFSASPDVIGLEVLASKDQQDSIKRALGDLNGVTVSEDASLSLGTARISIKRNEFEMNIEQVEREISEILSSCQDESRVEV